MKQKQNNNNKEERKMRALYIKWSFSIYLALDWMCGMDVRVLYLATAAMDKYRLWRWRCNESALLNIYPILLILCGRVIRLQQQQQKYNAKLTRKRKSKRYRGLKKEIHTLTHTYPQTQNTQHRHVYINTCRGPRVQPRRLLSKHSFQCTFENWLNCVWKYTESFIYFASYTLAT